MHSYLSETKTKNTPTLAWVN